MATISVGSRFSSYEELEKAIYEYENEIKTTFYKRESKTLENATKKNKNLENARPELKYYLLKYTCIAGGRIHRKKCTDGSRKSKTFRQNCPAFIQVLLSPDKQFLVIKSMNVNHVHLVSNTKIRSLPKNRKIPAEYREKVLKYTNLEKRMSKMVSDEENECREIDSENVSHYMDVPSMPLSNNFDINQENWEHTKVSTPRVIQYQQGNKTLEVQDLETLRNAIKFQTENTQQLEKINNCLEKIQNELNVQNFLKLKKLQLLCKIHNIDETSLNLNVQHELITL